MSIARGIVSSRGPGWCDPLFADVGLVDVGLGGKNVLDEGGRLEHLVQRVRHVVPAARQQPRCIACFVRAAAPLHQGAGTGALPPVSPPPRDSSSHGGRLELVHCIV